MSTTPGMTEAEQLRQESGQGGVFSLIFALARASLRVAHGHRLDGDKKDEKLRAAEADIALVQRALAKMRAAKGEETT